MKIKDIQFILAQLREQLQGQTTNGTSFTQTDLKIQWCTSTHHAMTHSTQDLFKVFQGIALNVLSNFNNSHYKFQAHNNHRFFKRAHNVSTSSRM